MSMWPSGKTLILLFFFFACATAWPSHPAFSEDKTIGIAADDAEMNAAITKARASLPQFWAAYEKPPPGVELFSLKVAITDSNGTEHFWTEGITRSDGKISAVIGNDPEMVKSVKLGQRIEVNEEDISDWMFIRNGKIVGNETLRPLLKHMPEDEAAYYRSMLEVP